MFYLKKCGITYRMNQRFKQIKAKDTCSIHDQCFYNLKLIDKTPSTSVFVYWHNINIVDNFTLKKERTKQSCNYQHTFLFCYSFYRTDIAIWLLQRGITFVKINRVAENTSWSPPWPPSGGIVPGWSGGWTRTARMFWPSGCSILETSRECLLNMPLGRIILCPFK